MKGMLRTGAVLALAIAGLAGQAGAGLAVSPLKREITVVPGKEVEFFITVTYNVRGERPQPQPVAMSLADIKIAQDARIEFPKPGSIGRSAAKWITLSDPAFSMKPNEVRRVKCILRVPYGQSGERSAVVLTKVGRPKKRKGSPVMIQYQVATVVFVHIKGRTFPKKAKVERVGVVIPETAKEESRHPREPAKRRPLEIVATVWNQGEVSFVAKGQARIRSMEGKRRAWPPVELKAGTRRIFPGGRRDYVAAVPHDLPAGKYEVRVAYDYGNKWRQARGKATFELKEAIVLKRNLADAAAGPALKVEPAKVDICLPPGATRNVILTVHNLRDAAVALSAKVAAETPGEENWLSLPSAIILRKGCSRKTRLTVRAPADLKKLHEFSVTFTDILGDKVVVPVSVSPRGQGLAGRGKK